MTRHLLSAADLSLDDATLILDTADELAQVAGHGGNLTVGPLARQRPRPRARGDDLRQQPLRVPQLDVDARHRARDAAATVHRLADQT